MIHRTAKNQPKHHYYTTAVVNNPSFRKFPADLRRAAIADALGIVSSFQTRYRDWQSGMRKKRSARAPSLVFNSCGLRRTTKIIMSTRRTFRQCPPYAII